VLRTPPLRFGRKRCVRLLRRRRAPEGRDRRGAMMEETMKLWTVTELMHLTCVELFHLAAGISEALPDLESGTVDRLNALTSLINIRRVMALRKSGP
jgi:hypothetical protein